MGVCVYESWYNNLVFTINDFSRIIHRWSQTISLADRSDAIALNKKSTVHENVSILIDSNDSRTDEKSRSVAVTGLPRHDDLSW